MKARLGAKARSSGWHVVRWLIPRPAAVVATALAAAVCRGGEGDAPPPGSPGTPAAAASTSAAEANGFDSNLPSLGTTFVLLPAGAGKQIADLSCAQCHSSDIVRQQRLQAKQWAAVVDKMIRWGAVVPEAHKAELIDYLAGDFGPDNDRFAPIITRPVGD
jgi:hypothetical protein